MDDNDTIIESRTELMLSPSYGNNIDPSLRTAYFLKPCIKDSPPLHFLPPHFSQTATNPTKLKPEVRYNGWRNPPEEWKTWVRKLLPKFEYLWIEAGIGNAIKASTYDIKRDDSLILELATRWCSETNTFVFPWGEATITLEDTKVCCGYSILGCSVSSPLVNSEQKEAEEELFEARRMFNRSKARKVAQNPWIDHFMETESKVEHEAFLVYWLSRFVFPTPAFDTISKSVIPIAIHLAQGNRIALAPAVLASIYRDLSVLNSTMKNNAKTIKNLSVTLWAPFQLLQVWALERFPALKPHSYATWHVRVQPRVARWGGLNMKKCKNLKLMLDSAGFRNRFLWRPYENSPSVIVYNEKDSWECDNPCLDEELRSFARCLRVCELEGIGCKEQYLPHRVAMQFGMDQDIPAMVDGCKKDPWMTYIRPVEIMDLDLCFALCFSQPGVTSRYYDWWKQSKTREQGDATKDYCDHCQVKIEEPCGTPPGFTFKFENDQVAASDKLDLLSDFELLKGLSSEAKRSNDVVVGNDKAFSNSQSGGVFPSSSVGDETHRCGNEAKIKSLFDLENRIQKLESVIAKLKAAIFGDRAPKVVSQVVNMGDNPKRPAISKVYSRKNKVGLGGSVGVSLSISHRCGNEAKIKSLFDLENRIQKLERVIAKLKAARYGDRAPKVVSQVVNMGDNPKRPAILKVYSRKKKVGLGGSVGVSLSISHDPMMMG